MRPAVEFLGFASAAAVAHLAVFAAALPDGQQAAGAGGADIVTIAAPLGAADDGIANLVRRWEAPVRAITPEATAAPPARDTAPRVPVSSPASSAPQLPQAMARPATAPSQPLQQDAVQTPDLFDMPESRTTPRPRARPEPRRAAPQRAARAAGAGAAVQQGTGAAPEQSGAGARAQLLAQWGGRIRAAIQRQHRSPGLRARGTVHLHLQVSADGRLAGVHLAQGSGHAALDRAALQAVQRARLPRAPDGLEGVHQFNLPVTFE